MENIIKLQSVFFNYGEFRAIDDISLDIGQGVYGLLGPNGAGKTTLLKIFLGFLTPNSGSGSVLGLNITSARKAVRRKIGYMPENECLIPGMDGVTLTAYLGELSGMPKQEAMKRAHEVLYYVGLEESRYRKVDTYSAGMKQRLKLAQALVHDPRLLLLDEPTSGMDPRGRKEMLELIKDISRKESMDVIICSHLLPDIEYTCKQVIIMNRGKIAAHRAIEGISEDKFNRFDLKLKGDVSAFLKQLKSIKCEVDITDRGVYKIRLPADESPQNLFKVALKNNVQIRHFEQCKTTLEDTFVNAVGVNNGH
ncbi:MAG: ABC transporter ATP-binding protein [Candidatus Aminicenantes bacterium]|nr:ABC transporter ATP-binding protein [Candidatus Aminicenantes bacterium]